MEVQRRWDEEMAKAAAELEEAGVDEAADPAHDSDQSEDEAVVVPKNMTELKYAALGCVVLLPLFFHACVSVYVVGW